MTVNKPTGASFNRGNSKQDFATPADFRAAVVKRFGMPALDLAADTENHFGPSWFNIKDGDDSFKENWHNWAGLMWLNPPFGDIEPWAKKCFEESILGAHILLLTPASVGSVWFSRYVHDTATSVYFLSPRLCFDGKAPYPKDCILSEFGGPKLMTDTRYVCWRWKQIP